MNIRNTSLLTCLLIHGCASTPTSSTWPAELPPQKVFIEYCQKNNNSCFSQDKTNDHLMWVKRFYYGSILYPTGWNDMIDIVIASMNDTQDKTSTRGRLNELGLDIVLEWVKDNNVRLINSQMLAIWANALAASAEQGEQLEFISLIENDVEQILAAALESKEISSDRYYGVEDYDNF